MVKSSGPLLKRCSNGQCHDVLFTDRVDYQRIEKNEWGGNIHHLELSHLLLRRREIQLSTAGGFKEKDDLSKESLNLSCKDFESDVEIPLVIHSPTSSVISLTIMELVSVQMTRPFGTESTGDRSRLILGDRLRDLRPVDLLRVLRRI
ncbi:hypothetical protein OUZ56_021595 [Daphnia magna]|uniref:Uncharacterized protein n=1 Tax=Daphnia magna TaxID=35525 RepID=A0ABR0AU13_9CRUS|nr:hypothetical protein OUZ56_021595 [Daphnia magna]